MPLRAGQWLANGEVTGSALSAASTGTQQLEVAFKTDDPKTPTIRAFLFLTDKAISQTHEALTVLGWKPEEYDFDLSLLNGTQALVGKKATLVLEVETYNGKARTKIRFINRPGGVREAMTPEAASAFSATVRDKMRAAFLAKGGKIPTPVPVGDPDEQKLIDEALKNSPF